MVPRLRLASAWINVGGSHILIGNRSRDLPACSIVPQPTTLPRAPVKVSYQILLLASYKRNRLRHCSMWEQIGLNGKSDVKVAPLWTPVQFTQYLAHASSRTNTVTQSGLLLVCRLIYIPPPCMPEPYWWRHVHCKWIAVVVYECFSDWFICSFFLHAVKGILEV
jgi:hypothetical protein